MHFICIRVSGQSNRNESLHIKNKTYAAKVCSDLCVGQLNFKSTAIKGAEKGTNNEISKTAGFYQITYLF